MAILSRSRRYAAVLHSSERYAAPDTNRLYAAVLDGSRLSGGSWHQVFVDVASRSQQAGIAEALSKHPAVSCVDFEALAVPASGLGASPGQQTPLAPLPWPTRAQLGAHDDCTVGWAPKAVVSRP